MLTLQNPMKSMRCCHCVVKTAFGIYLLGGKMGKNAIKTVEMMNLCSNDGLEDEQRIQQIKDLSWNNKSYMKAYRQNFGACAVGQNGPNEKILVYGYGTGQQTRQLGFAYNYGTQIDYTQPKIMTFELYDPILNTWSDIKPESGMSNLQMKDVFTTNCTFVTMVNYRSEKDDLNNSGSEHIEKVVILQTAANVNIPTEVLLLTYIQKLKKVSPISYNDPFSSHIASPEIQQDGRPTLKLQKLGFLMSNRKVNQNNCFVQNDKLIVVGGQLGYTQKKSTSLGSPPEENCINQVEIFDLIQAISNIENRASSFGPHSSTILGQSRGK